jgi:acetylornithine deacetylase
MAAMLAACDRLARERPRGRATVVMACTVNEEHGFSGAARAARSWTHGESKLFTRRPDAAIVAEPTLLKVVVAHKGVVRWRVRTIGKAAHSSRPALGENAIYRMARVVAALEEYAQTVVGTKGEHRLLGSPSLSVGLIAGGISVNTVPDSCAIEIDRRILPREDPVAAREDVITFVEAKTGLGDKIVHEPSFIIAYGLGDDENGPLAASLAKTLQAAGLPGECIGVPYGTDASVFAAAQTPSVVFGPGSIDQAHTADEWVEIDQLEKAADIYYRFAAGH